MTFALANLSNAVLWVTFAPISSLTEEFFNVSQTAVNAFSVSYLALYIPGSLAALVVYSFRKNGLWTGVVLGSAATAIGAMMRYLATLSEEHPVYGLALAGQCLAALAQPFLTNVPPKVAAAWFPTNERDVATAIAAMANVVGIALGSVLPAIFVMQDEDENVTGMGTLLLVEAILAAVATVVAAVFVRSRPLEPPSAAAEKEAMVESNESVFRVLSTNVVLCMTNRHFLVLFVAFGIGLGIFNAIATLIEQIVAPFCYNEDDASLFAGLMVGCGLLSAGAVGAYLDKTHRYHFVLKLLFSLATVAFIACSLVLRPDASAGLSVTFAVLGATMLPILPTALEAAVECTHPVPEEYSSGLIMSSGMITGIGFIYGLERLTDAQPTCEENMGEYYFSGTSAVLLGCGALATAIVFQFRGPLLRLQAEHEIEVANDDGRTPEVDAIVAESPLPENEEM
jgi:FLVCR family MFS transporter 7